MAAGPVLQMLLPLYAPGKLTVAGEVLPPPVICNWAHSIYREDIVNREPEFKQRQEALHITEHPDKTEPRGVLSREK